LQPLQRSWGFFCQCWLAEACGLLSENSLRLVVDLLREMWYNELL